jgi:DNA-binding transcriptional MerR regulator
MLSIGRFARLSGLTVKALRHYDEVGLLQPAQVDEWTGYRWYARDQVREAVAVRRRRSLRVPLGQVAVLVDEPAGRFAVIRDRVRVDDMFTHVPETIVRVCRWLDAHGIPYDGRPLTIFLGNGIDEWLDVEVGWPIGEETLDESDGVFVRQLPPARAAEHVHRRGAARALRGDRGRELATRAAPRRISRASTPSWIPAPRRIPRRS